MKPQSTTLEIEGKKVPVSNLQKVLYPEAGFTKGEVINYYIQIAPAILPHLHDRPLTLKRYPNGVAEEFFYAKRAPTHKPSWVKTAHVGIHSDETGGIDYVLANDLPSLVWIANQAALELHPLLAKKQKVTCPTQLMFDLDPGAPATAIDCAEVALLLRAFFAKLKLESFIKSSGSKGLQLHIPLNTPTSYDVTKAFARTVAEAFTAVFPDRVVYDMKKVLRGGKVLIDWSQNDDSKTTIGAYSLRAKSHPFAAAPLEWREVEAARKGEKPEVLFFQAGEVVKRFEKKGDLFAPLLTLKQKVPKLGLDEARELLADLGEKNTAARASKSRASKAATTKKTTGSKSKSAAAKVAKAPATSAKKLAAYHAKRDFKKTAEPSGKEKAAMGEENFFVIQKHDASHLHYDFRLAMDGVLKSWAVPKTIPTTKGEKHLAMEVEDHPLDYARFEGIIPAGEYGGGTVMVWDIGTYTMLGGTPGGAWHQGMMHFELKGKKLNGEWTLVRMRSDSNGKTPWLLLKSGEDVKAISAKVDDSSALTKRTMAQIANQKKAVWHSNKGSAADARAKKGKAEERASAQADEEKPSAPLTTAVREKLLRRFVEPMKAKPVETAPEGEGWAYELKFDGYRALAICDAGKVLLISRNRKPYNERFAPLVDALGQLPVKRAIFDGEIIAMDAEGRHSFQSLQNDEDGDLAYYIFDLLELDGKSWRGHPLTERKAKLGEVLSGVASPLFFSANLEGKASTIWSAIKKQKLEGLIAKRRDSVYEVGQRSGQWMKVKTVNQQEFLIGGFTEPEGARSHFGALLVGVREGERVRYCGKVGTGFSRKSLGELHRKMKDLEVEKCPFFNLPTPRNSRWGGGITASQMKMCTWLDPKLIAEVKFTEWTRDESLRHPAFLGLREDLSPDEVHRERPAALNATRR